MKACEEHLQHTEFSYNRFDYSITRFSFLETAHRLNLYIYDLTNLSFSNCVSLYVQKILKLLSIFMIQKDLTFEIKMKYYEKVL